jgi:sulfite reductase (NADPH) flavoprotein alpha-component
VNLPAPTVPVLPETAPFTAEQRAWLNGFLAGLLSRSPAPSPAPAAAPAPTLAPLTVLFGSQTGTAESLARKAAKQASRRGFAPAVIDMAQTDLAQLASTRNLLVLVSTYGDGEPPDNARTLHAALTTTPPGTSLAGVRFSVCALGDRNYPQFCRCGQEFDSLLERLGATRAAPRTDCDTDYEAPFAHWLEASLAALADNPRPAPLPASPPAPTTPDPALPTPVSRKNPFAATVSAVRRLSAPGSAKEVHHVEISLEGSGLTYLPGDALGVYPNNDPALVDEVLAALGCDGEEAVPAPDANPTSLHRALTEFYDLGKPTPELLACLGLTAAADPGPHLIDALLRARAAGAATSDLTRFVSALRPLAPRLYSIASSPLVHPAAVHLTVGAVRYPLGGRLRLGVCSTFLAERARAAGRARVFLHPNSAFHLPADPSTPLILVGPGTGIAPFRAFLQHRAATGATGKIWLFFGDQHEATDFLYRDEILAWHRDGLITRLDLAWSRDQAEKIYVQHRLLAHAAELYAWLEHGASFYVCGDASRMARDVDTALHRVIQDASGRSPEAAAAYVQALRTAKRYRRDVY